MNYGTSWHTNFYPRHLYVPRGLIAKPAPENRSDNSTDEASAASLEPLDVFFPEGILEKVFSNLPIDSLIRASSVSKQWYDAVYRGKYRWNTMLQQKPWYFMFTCDGVSGFAYDPQPRKWFRYEIPCIEMSNWNISSSCGLVCMMDTEDKSRVFVCNPIAKASKKLPEAPSNYPDYSALALSVNTDSECYAVAVVECRQAPTDFCLWEFSIHVYESRVGKWMSTFLESLDGWRGGDECVICGDSLYYLMYSTAVMGDLEAPRHCVVRYGLSGRVAQGSLMDAAVPVPCPLTCGRLMNLRDRLVMVGGIGKRDRPGIIKGIGIWELKGKEWREVARMPHKYFQGFGEFDDVFASSGAGDLVYIQSFGSPALLTFNIQLKQWKWSSKGLVTKRFPLQLFTGFCFEPRIEVTC